MPARDGPATDAAMASPTTLIGLASQEAGHRLAQHGPNELEDREKQGLARTLAGVATEPMFLLLLAAAAIYLLLGDLGEGLLLAFFALVTVGLVIVQQRRSARALDALRALAAPQVRAIRDMIQARLHSSGPGGFDVAALLDVAE